MFRDHFIAAVPALNPMADVSKRWLGRTSLLMAGVLKLVTRLASMGDAQAIECAKFDFETCPKPTGRHPCLQST